ncbi:ferric reductase-like transmembrane domain-containing protein [Actinoalloteichus hymeniacidonis]|uniref:Ferric reductase like transmembrane component n=1 Tax=Actinoalloteichus hymeniacidonis TaxID=340345 RepID=A0AAC9MZ43_9PSEU|nr:ferric reductase-like transmembrane domain-containing protein [Actinoalloteichus hymeniacidonis]AOS64079.1 Ferric reductase like transmembrane component [Actinoalloteichus hymeniacidonis]MBB5907859.1 DMSO/TMAO reductase YedYZ heme-binding membrane subunit [Actinoalloteichus hymeniacidonis]
MVATEARVDGERRRTGLRADLRAAIPDATAALVITVAIFIWLYSRVRAGISETVEVMPYLADANQYWMYWLCQAFGWSALLWAYITTVLGLVRSSSRPSWQPFSTVRIERWHRTTSLTTIGLMFAHAFLFFLELARTNDNNLDFAGRWVNAFVESFVPGGYPSGTGQVAILLGLLALYLAIPLGLLYYLRNRTGARMWRALHRFVIVVYILSAWHTLLYGTNVWFDGWPRTALWLLQIPIAVLLILRLVSPARRGDKLGRGTPVSHVIRRVVAVLAVVAAIGAILAVVITGRDGGRTRDVTGAAPSVLPWMVWTGFAVFVLGVGVAVLLVRRAERARVAARKSPSEPASEPADAE